MSNTKEKDGSALLDEAAADATIDEVMRRDPREVSDDDLREMIEASRAKRALFIQAGQKRKEKKAGVQDPEEKED